MTGKYKVKNTDSYNQEFVLTATKMRKQVR